MIDKQEYIDLYCDEFIYRMTGVIGLDDRKLAKRMRIDKTKTIRDLADYGISADFKDNVTFIDVDKSSSSNNVLDRFANDMGGSIDMLDDFIEALEKERQFIEAYDEKLLDFDEDNFDWGSEDSIK